MVKDDVNKTGSVVPDPVQRAAGRIYVYDYSPIAGHGKFVLPGDYMIVDDSAAGNGDVRMVSSRGVDFRYSTEEFQGALEAGDVKPAFPDGATPEDLAAVYEKCREQMEYRDAAAYYANKDGNGSSAVFLVEEGHGRRPCAVSVERDLDEFWCYQGVSGKFMDADKCGYDGFNPKGGPIFPISESERFTREEKRSEMAKPFNKFLATIGKMAGKEPEPLPGDGPRRSARDILGGLLQQDGMDKWPVTQAVLQVRHDFTQAGKAQSKLDAMRDMMAQNEADRQYAGRDAGDGVPHNGYDG